MGKVSFNKNKMKIEQIIKELENEVKEIENEAERNKTLLQLQETAEKYQGKDKVISSLELAEKIKNRPEETKIMTGFQGVDKILDGFRKNQLVIVSAATKSGKTSWCVDLTSNMKNENPLWLPFEESAEELIIKFQDRGEQPPLFYTPETITGNTLVWVEKKIIESIAKYNTKIVFIDHLHFIVDMAGENMSVQIGKTMRELKQIAKRWNIVIVLIAHLKKTKMDTQPSLEDLRDSSFIAQEADTVIMLWRETKIGDSGEIEITDNVNISVQANRRTGKTGNVKMIFKDGRFFEQDWVHKDEVIDDSWGI